jgi:hypothetical protein
MSAKLNLQKIFQFMKLGRRDWIRRFVSIRFVVDIREALSSGPAPGCCLSECGRGKTFQFASSKAFGGELFASSRKSLYFHFALRRARLYGARGEKKTSPEEELHSFMEHKTSLFHSLLLAREIY